MFTTRFATMSRLTRAALVACSRVVVAMMLIVLPGTQSPAFGQTSSQMCGDGTTFTVNLPGTGVGFLNGTVHNFTVESGPSSGPDDAVTLPGGCRIYALLVSGYDQNHKLNRIIFYKLAEFIAQNDGYVHVSWWNNLIKEYMGGPLHDTTVTIDPPLFSGSTFSMTANPGGHPRAELSQHLFLPQNFLNVPKALPVEDVQFQNDAARTIRGIKANNPDAVVIVAGHGMGAASVARLLSWATDLQVDLLAIIDAVGNRDAPLDAVTELLAHGDTKSKLLEFVTTRAGLNFNWTRSRAVNEFRGYKRWDCLRGPFGLCKSTAFGRGVFGAICLQSGAFLDEWPLLTTIAPLCPLPVPYIDEGVTNTFTSNVRRLYHRWQDEYFGPVDFWGFSDGGIDARFYLYNHPVTRTTSLPGANVQSSMATCTTGIDPHDSSIDCSPFDGHGELVGMRGGDLFGFERTYPGLQMKDWPTDAASRREKFIEMATANEFWPHRPANPDLCLVCDDLIQTVQSILDELPGASDTTPPSSSATSIPQPNDNGWHNGDTVVVIHAADNAGGSGVREIDFALSGAQSAAATQPGDTAQIDVQNEGMTTVTFFARDNAGIAEASKSLTVRLDRIPPDVTADATPLPNELGWHRSEVTVTFAASDALSGLAEFSGVEPVLVTSEGDQQEVVGVASDLAGNRASATAVINLDKTAPSIGVTRTPGANALGWNNGDVTISFACADALSGLAAGSPPADTVVSAEGPGQSVTGTCADLADNSAEATEANIRIDKTAPAIVGAPQRAPDSSGWYNHAVEIGWTCTDALSGIAACSPPATYDGPDSASATVSGSATDKGGNGADDSVSLRFDATAPAIALDTPRHDAVFLLNQTVEARYSCSDNLSGVAACAGTTARGASVDTATVGRKEFGVHASDVAGNNVSRAHSYDVHYVFEGFFRPVDNLPVANVVTAGRTIPLKWLVKDANGVLVLDPASLVSLLSSPVACDASPTVTLDEEEEIEAAGATVLTFTGTHWQYNWKTSSGWSGCRLLQLSLADGTQHYAKFRFQ